MLGKHCVPGEAHGKLSPLTSLCSDFLSFVRLGSPEHRPDPGLPAWKGLQETLGTSTLRCRGPCEVGTRVSQPAVPPGPRGASRPSSPPSHLTKVFPGRQCSADMQTVKCCTNSNWAQEEVLPWVPTSILNGHLSAFVKGGLTLGVGGHGPHF